MQCPTCGKWDAPDARYCDQCGNRIPDSTFADLAWSTHLRVIELFNPAQPRVGAGAATGGQFAPPGSQPAAKGKPPAKQPAHPTANQQRKAALEQQIKNDRLKIAALRKVLSALAKGQITAQAARLAATKAGSIGKTKAQAGAVTKKSGAPAKTGAAATSAAAAKAKAPAKKAGPLTAKSEAAVITKQIGVIARQIATAVAQAAKLANEGTEAVELTGPKGYSHGWLKAEGFGKHLSGRERQDAGMGQPFGKRLSKKEASGFADMFAGDTRKQRVYASLKKGGKSHSKAKAVLAKARAHQVQMSSVTELVGPKGYIHGWIKVDAGTGFAAGLQPGSFEHLKAIEDLGAKAAMSEGDPANQSPTMQSSLHNLARSLAERDIAGARVHLASAKWANRREAGGKWKRDLADLEHQIGRVPKQATGWQENRYNPLTSRAQHPGEFVPSSGPPAHVTAGALRIPTAAMGYSWEAVDSAVELSARTAMLEKTPAPRGKPGGPGLYNVKGMGHTAYEQQIVKALIEKRGMAPGKAYAIARAAIRRWSRGGGHVHPEVRAAAGKAEAGELEKQARAKAKAA